MVSHYFSDSSNRAFSFHRDSFCSDTYQLRNHSMWPIPFTVLSQGPGMKTLDFREYDFEYR